LTTVDRRARRSAGAAIRFRYDKYSLFSHHPPDKNNNNLTGIAKQ